MHASWLKQIRRNTSVKDSSHCLIGSMQLLLPSNTSEKKIKMKTMKTTKKMRRKTRRKMKKENRAMTSMTRRRMSQS